MQENPSRDNPRQRATASWTVSDTQDAIMMTSHSLSNSPVSHLPETGESVPRHTANLLTNSIEHSQPLNLADIGAGAWRYRWSAIVITSLLFPLLMLVVFLIPVKYDSTARLLVRLGRGAVSIDPTANLSQTVSLLESRLGQVNSVKELLSSREIAERVTKKVGIDRVLQPHGLVEETLDTVLGSVLPKASVRITGNLSPDEVDRQLELEEAYKKFANNLTLKSEKDAYTIEVSMRTGDPFLSRDLMRNLVDEYQRFHVESHQSVGSLAFFENHAREAQQRAMAAQNALRDAKTARGIVDLGGAKGTLVSSIAALRQSKLSAESELAFSEAELKNLEQQIATLPANIESEVTRGIPNLAGSGMRQRLYELEVSYEDLASKVTDDHPRMLALKDQLKSAAEIAKTTEGEQPQTVEAVNPIRQHLELSHKTTTAKAFGTRTKLAAIESQLEQSNRELSELNKFEVELNQLTWEANLAESEYMRASSARSTARQIAELDNQNLSEISIVQPATLSLKKSTPKRSILSVLAMMLAIATGFGQAIIRGLIDDAKSNPFKRSKRPTGVDEDLASRQEWVDGKRTDPGHESVVRDDLVTVGPR
jgi:uncharacterized protein involved in exopolysaccharide biosynthesis